MLQNEWIIKIPQEFQRPFALAIFCRDILLMNVNEEMTCDCSEHIYTAIWTFLLVRIHQKETRSKKFMCKQVL